MQLEARRWRYRLDALRPGRAESNLPKVQIGVDATWSGNRLIIPTSFANFEGWLTGVYEGMIINTASTPISANWGYVNVLSAPTDNSALWLDVVWVQGTKPTSGFIWRGGRYRRLLFASNNQLLSGTTWNDPAYMKQTTTPFQVNYGFPAGLPLQYA